MRTFSRQIGCLRKKSEMNFPFMVRYLTTNGKLDTSALFKAFALRYRRVNATFYESAKFRYDKLLGT